MLRSDWGTGMTYFGFLALFLVPPILVLLAATRRMLRREHLLALGALMLIALLYTSPWDNYLVIRGVWTFDRDKIAGWFIWRVPLEEYIFYVLQVLLTGLFTIYLTRFAALTAPPSPAGKGVPPPAVGAGRNGGSSHVRRDEQTAVERGTPFPAGEGGRGVRSAREGRTASGTRSADA